MLKKKIIRKIENIIYEKTWYGLLSLFSGRKYDGLYSEYKGEKKAFLLMEPEYGNLGDQAIAYASEKFIKDKFSEYKLITVTEKDTYKHINSIKKVCSSEDLIFIQGGGNMGTLYPYIERMRRFCVEHFPNQMVISMPTSIFYRDDGKGEREFNKGLKTYNSHKNLILLARDKVSFEFMAKNYPNARALLVPDIVFYLYDSVDNKTERGDDVIVCLRKENESAIGEQKRTEIIKYLDENLSGKYFIYDTTVWRDVPKEMRELEIKSLFHCFAKAKCVVTDRMHGMIISAITHTPCVVLPSLGGKVVGSYEWIKDTDYIKLVSEPNCEKIMDKIHSINAIDTMKDISYVLDGFEQIRNFVLKDGRTK